MECGSLAQVAIPVYFCFTEKFLISVILKKKRFWNSKKVSLFKKIQKLRLNAANWSGVQNALSLAFTSAPFSKRILATFSCPAEIIYRNLHQTSYHCFQIPHRKWISSLRKSLLDFDIDLFLLNFALPLYIAQWSGV